MHELVLVTGGSGFVAEYTIAELLKQGFRVRATVRTPSRETEVRSALGRLGLEPDIQVEFVEADLTEDAGWQEAAVGASFVLHVASPFPGSPASLEALLPPARDGTLRVLKAARATAVRRVVLTSSFAAIGYGSRAGAKDYTEADWTDGDEQSLSPYIRSKTLAERAAWDWLAEQPNALELTVVNPVGIFGPALGPKYSSSLRIVASLLAGKIPFSPHQEFGIVDVRDLARLQAMLMTEDSAANRRFIAASDGIWTIARIGKLLKDALGRDGRRAASIELPDLAARMLARINPRLGIEAKELGKSKRISNAAAKALGWQPRPGADTLLDTARSLLALGKA